MIFGEGLSDAETLPSQFATRLREPAHVVNLCVLGYAPNHLVRALENGLYDAHATGKVDAVLTWIIPSHLPRVTGDESWLASSPRYAFDGSGQLRHTGTFSAIVCTTPWPGCGTLRATVLPCWRVLPSRRSSVSASPSTSRCSPACAISTHPYGAPLILLYNWPDQDLPGETGLALSRLPRPGDARLSDGLGAQGDGAGRAMARFRHPTRRAPQCPSDIRPGRRAGQLHRAGRRQDTSSPRLGLRPQADHRSRGTTTYPAALRSSDRMTASESVTKPKHFFTFQTVASVQKSGDVVAQQSSTRMQP